MSESNKRPMTGDEPSESRYNPPRKRKAEVEHRERRKSNRRTHKGASGSEMGDKSSESERSVKKALMRPAIDPTLTRRVQWQREKAEVRTNAIPSH